MRFLRRAALVIVGLLVLAVVAPLVLLTVGVRIDVSRFREPIGQAATEGLGRKVDFEGQIFVVPAFWPTLEIEGLRIEDPLVEGAPDFARLEHARIELGALALLRGRLRLGEIRAKGVRLHLVRYADGRANWVFEAPGGRAPEEAPEPSLEAEPPEDRTAPAEVPLVELQELSLSDVAVTYLDEAKGAAYELAIDTCSGGAKSDLGMKLDIAGSYQKHPFSIALVTGTIADLMKADPESPLDFSLEIAGTRLELAQVGEAPGGAASEAGAVMDYRLSLEGERLDRFDPILSLALPPLGPYGLRARVHAVPGELELPEFELRVGETLLSGRGSVVTEGERPRADVELAASRFQLDDFRLEGWSPTGAQPAADAEEAPEAPSGTDGEPVRSLVDPEVMRRLDAKLSLEVEEVRSGRDRLGGGRLVATLEDGRFSIEPLVVRLPGGSFEMNLELETSAAEAEGRIRLEIEGFDLGVPVRRANPESDMGGTLDLDVEIASRAPDVAALMAHADGHVDFSLLPQNLEAGVLDLWAVNLVAAVLPLVAPGGESKVNCVVALLDVEDGRMQQQSLLIDTSRIQVRGEAQVDFESQEVAVTLKPRPKRPQFFSLATPIQVNGNFDDFGVGVTAADLLGTVISLATDVATYPARVLLLKRIPADGEEACAAARRRNGPPSGK
jgi:uncharacterized protein involved in outer membrane biogenesis